MAANEVPMADIWEVQLEHVKNDETYAVYAIDRHGICHDQELFRYNDEPGSKVLARKGAIAAYKRFQAQYPAAERYSDL
jgi:hypothetical protein